jgi:transcriptional regulator with XRE-family HTH domain
MTGRELKTLREQLGWSQARLAAAVGVASNSIARQERGEMGIKESLARLIRIVAEQAKHDKNAAHAGPSRRAAAHKPTKGSGTTRAESKGRRRPRKNSVPRVGCT